MPKGGLLDAAIVLKGGGTAEGVYRILPQEPENDKGKGKGPPPTGGYPSGQPLDSLHEPTKDSAETAKIRAETKIKIAQAREVAAQAGKLSSDLDRLVKDLIASETDWRSVLHRFFSERAKTDYSYARPKRRFLAEDIYLPGLVGDRLGRVVIAVDCSGSVSDELLEVFATEVKGLVQDTRPTEVEVLYFDTEVLRSEVFAQDSEVVINATGGGGTAFSPIFEHVNRAENPPACVVVLTDLVCEDFGPIPSYPVLWASVLKRRSPVPFGEVTLIKKEGKK
jgi:predicted metal-dependent peptidase